MKGANGEIIAAGLSVESIYSIAEVSALRELRETCGMYCEQLPLEVREALHRIPEIEKQHRHETRLYEELVRGQ